MTIEEARAIANEARRWNEDAGNRADDAREEQKAEQAYAQMLAEQDTTTSATTRREPTDQDWREAAQAFAEIALDRIAGEAAREETPPPPSETAGAGAAPSLEELIQIGDPPTLEDAAEAFKKAAMEPCEAIVGLLSEYDAQRTIATTAEGKKEARGKRIKAHLEHCKEHHDDGEHDLEAQLEDKAVKGQADGVLDCRSMALKNPQMLIELAIAGAISADVGMVKKQQTQLPAAHDAIQRYLMPGARTFSLAVRKRSGR